jgi:hypothetical protein
MKKMSEHKTIEDWLELSEEFKESNPFDSKGKKRVRPQVHFTFFIIGDQ